MKERKFVVLKIQVFCEKIKTNMAFFLKSKTKSLRIQGNLTNLRLNCRFLDQNGGSRFFGTPAQKASEVKPIF